MGHLPLLCALHALREANRLRPVPPHRHAECDGRRAGAGRRASGFGAIRRGLPGLLLALAFVAPLAPPLTAAEGRLEVTVVDKEGGKPIACRMQVKNAAGRPKYARKSAVWDDHFNLPGEATLVLPLGQYSFEVQRGLEYLVTRGYFTFNANADDAHQVELERFIDLREEGWWSADFDVRRPAAQLPLLLAAEDLRVLQPVGWSNTGRDYRPGKPPEGLEKNRWLLPYASLEQRPGGARFFGNLSGPLEMAPAEAEFPPPGGTSARAREKGRAWIDATRPDWWDLPAWVAHGDIDSIRLLPAEVGQAKMLPTPPGARPHDPKLYPGSWGPTQWGLDVYFHLLNCGLRLPPTAGSGSGESPNPAGANRFYVHLPGKFSLEKWWAGLLAGAVVVTNGPLLAPSIDGRPPGHVFKVQRDGELELEIGLTLSIRDPEQQPIAYLEIIENGRPLRSIRFAEYAKTGRLPKITIRRSGWFLIRAVCEVKNTYRFAMTAPYFVEVGYQKAVSRASAQFFLDWVYQRARQIEIDDPAQRQAVVQYHREARDYWQQVVKNATMP